MKSKINFEHFEKNITLIAHVFPKLQRAKDVVREMNKRSCFRRTFEKQLGKRVQPQLKSPRQHLYHICWSLWLQMSWKKSLLVICRILGLFVNTMTAKDKYSLLNRDPLRQSFQMQLSQKQKTFSRFFSVFLKSRLNFQHLQKKMTPKAYVSPKLQTAKDVVRRMSKRSGFGRSFRKQHGKRFQALLKSKDLHFFHIFRSL